VNLLVFILGMFIDFFEIAFIVVPILAPVADKMGIDLIWFGVMLCVNMQTSFMHPPFGFALFYLRGISDTLFKEGALPAKVQSRDIYLGSIPFIGLQLVLVAVVIAFPQTVTALLDRPEVIDPDKVRIELQAPAPQDDDNSRALEELTRGAQDAASAPR
jgi:TRAP-type mannitol/chloroaromatic compound transport system permease large subunit